MGKRALIELSDKQRSILEFINKYAQEHNGMAPTIAEMDSSLGYRTQGHLDALQRKGWITRTPRSPRGISIVRNINRDDELKRISRINKSIVPVENINDKNLKTLFR